jgi:hypothetical protein
MFSDQYLREGNYRYPLDKNPGQDFVVLWFYEFFVVVDFVRFKNAFLGHNIIFFCIGMKKYHISRINLTLVQREGAGV